MHHAIIQTISLVDLMNKLMDFTPNPAPGWTAQAAVGSPLPSPGESHVDAVREMFFSMIADSRMVPDLERVRALVLESFHELRPSARRRLEVFRHATSTLRGRLTGQPRL